MTPKEKASEFVNKYYLLFPDVSYDKAKQCALITVDYILQSHSGFEDNIWYNSKYKFYTEVKQEIEKL